MDICPLCGCSEFDQPPTQEDSKTAGINRHYERLLDGYEHLTRKQKRMLFWEMSGIILFSGILVTLIINLVLSKSITWSRYSITVCLVLFANISLLSFWRHRLFLLLGGSFVTTSLLLILLDMYNQKIGWGTQLGIPLLLSFYLVIIVLTWIIRKTKQHGFNVLGYIFLSVGFLSLCIEGILSWYFKSDFRFQWSLIVFACMTAIAAILFFIHYRLNRGMDLRRFFHI